MGRYNNKSYDERMAARKAKVENKQQARAGARKDNKAQTQRLISRLRDYMNDSGLMASEMSEFSGVDPATIIRIARKNHPSVRFATIVGVANACGYELTFVKKAPQDDQFRQYRKRYVNDMDPIPPKGK